MSERVVENEWREQAFDQPVPEPDIFGGFQALDREIESLIQDVRELSTELAKRTQLIAALRRQVADIARTLP